KKQIVREKKIEQVFREKEILGLLSTNENRHPFIVQLYCTFQDADSLYFALSYAPNKDLLTYLGKAKRLSLEQARFAVAELTSALGHIHSLSVVHRDVKPENCLLSATWHILLSDFGCAKKLGAAPKPEPSTEEASGRRRRCSFVGTAHYVSPEILNGVEVNETCDYWSLGVVIFHLVSGERPFNELSEYLMFQKILKERYDFPVDYPHEAKEIVSELLVVDTEKRLGSAQQGGFDALRNHSFFNGIQWDTLHNFESPLAPNK
ncbi:phosphoinositide-dependent protein kinase I, partial [Aphelenchoides avenae]